MISRRSLLRAVPVALVTPFISHALGPKVGSASALPTSATEHFTTVESHSYVSRLSDNAYVVKVYEGEKSASGLFYYRAYYESVFFENDPSQKWMDRMLRYVERGIMQRYADGVGILDASTVGTQAIDDMVTYRHSFVMGDREVMHGVRHVVQGGAE